MAQTMLSKVLLALAYVSVVIIVQCPVVETRWSLLSITVQKQDDSLLDYIIKEVFAQENDNGLFEKDSTIVWLKNPVQLIVVPVVIFIIFALILHIHTNIEKEKRKQEVASVVVNNSTQKARLNEFRESAEKLGDTCARLKTVMLKVYYRMYDAEDYGGMRWLRVKMADVLGRRWTDRSMPSPSRYEELMVAVRPPEWRVQ